MGHQSRSRAFIIQSPKNQESCSGQAMETRPCSGNMATVLLPPIKGFILVLLQGED